MKKYDAATTEKVEKLLERLLTDEHVCKFDITPTEMLQLQELNRTIQEARSLTRKRIVDVISGGIFTLLIYGLVSWLRR